MSTITTDSITGHEGTNDDSNHAENEKRNGKSDLLNRRPIVDGERRIHHNVFVCYRKRMIHIRHLSLYCRRRRCRSFDLQKKSTGFGEEGGDDDGGKSIFEAKRSSLPVFDSERRWSKKKERQKLPRRRKENKTFILINE